MYYYCIQSLARLDSPGYPLLEFDGKHRLFVSPPRLLHADRTLHMQEFAGHAGSFEQAYTNIQ